MSVDSERQSPDGAEDTPGKFRRVWKFFKSWWELPPRPDDGLTPSRYHEPGWLKHFVYIFIPGRVSRIHLYEAQERYLNLCRMLEYQAKVCTGEQTETDPTLGSSGSRLEVIELARKVLWNTQWLLTRRQNDLNYLWRELARVQIMLVEYVLPSSLLPTQLDLCREEARRVGATEEPAVKEMLERLAEATPEGASAVDSAGRERMVRGIRALVERFTTIRTDRIHQQFVNIRTYQKALIVLLVMSVCLIANKDSVLRPPIPATATDAADVKEGGLSSAAPAESQVTRTAVPATTPAVGSQDDPSAEPPNPGRLPALSPEGSGHLVNFWTGFKKLFVENILFFVFFAGLTGGFFSVVMRLRDRGLVPGEDAYFLWYVLSKPFVGALGAMILYILMQADFVTWEIMKGLADDLRSQTPGAAVFGFAFLSGFSERIVFPHFR